MSQQSITVTGFSIKVDPIPVPPLVVNPPTPNPQPDEQVGQSITTPDLATVSGGTPPYTASAINGSFPAGMSIAQVTNQITGAVRFFLTGTPTTAGTATFDLKITDSTP